MLQPSASPAGSTPGHERSSTRKKEPVVQLFLNLQWGLPRERVRVAVLVEGGRELTGTRPTEKQDPMFDEHLELFGEAAGKDTSQRLTFAVQSVGPGDRWREATMRTIATAHIASDELRRAGMYNPHEGAAVALPLRAVPEAWPATSPPLPRGAALHCYVHAGYHYQSSSRRHSLGGAAGGSPALRSTRGA